MSLYWRSNSVRSANYVVSLAEFKRLHAEGRFKVLFGLWKGIQQELTELSPEQLAQVEKDLQLCGEMIAELTDLQAYIATPRKQALIAEMQQLLDEPAVSINERATRIKQARAQWNSLGRADAALEETLNQQLISCLNKRSRHAAIFMRHRTNKERKLK